MAVYESYSHQEVKISPSSKLLYNVQWKKCQKGVLGGLEPDTIKVLSLQQHQPQQQQRQQHQQQQRKQQRQQKRRQQQQYLFGWNWV